MAKYTKEQAKAWKQELTNKCDSFLKDALETKDGFDKLTAHYRISGLYSYSFYNNMMIYSQGGKICQSKANWAKFDRSVIAGQRKSIYIWMPIFKYETLADGTKDKTFLGCKLVGTWDVSQTEGKALEYDHNSHDDMAVDYDKLKTVLEALTDAKVVETITGKARGVSNGEDMKVSEWSNDTDKAKTALHETAHHIIHTSTKAKKNNKVSYATGECEAESVAYLVMSFLGMDFELSKEYVASYKSGISEVRTKLVVDTADKIIKKIKATFTDEELFIAKI